MSTAEAMKQFAQQTQQAFSGLVAQFRAAEERIEKLEERPAVPPGLEVTVEVLDDVTDAQDARLAELEKIVASQAEDIAELRSRLSV